MALLSKFFGRTASEGAAFALGVATGPVLAPAVEEVRNEAWRLHQSRVLSAGEAAEIVAEDVERHDWGASEAAARGLSGDRFDALLGAVLNAPGVPQLLTLWRRDEITEAQFIHGLRKAKLEGLWDEPLSKLKDERLDPSQIALGIVRSLLKDPGFLPVTLDTAGGKVPAYGVSDLPVLAEAEAAGIDRERLRVMVGEIGLPMALEAAAGATFRNIIERADFNRAVLEGDTRPEWADAIFEQARQIPSVADYVNAHIRGWIDEAAMIAGASRHGMSAPDVRLLYLRTGRPAAPGQMATAAARGIDGPDKRPMDRAQFLKGIAESDIRPEWGPMLWDARFLYPPLFQLSRLVQAGAITADVAAEWARKDRYPPEVVDALHAYWTQAPATTKADSRVTLATTQAIAALKRRFILELTDEQGVTNGLQGIGISAESADQILNLWTFERLWTVKVLTPAQIKKEYTGGTLTLDDAIAQLVQQHYSVDDATRFLQS